jgi:hypothetical protein
MEPEDNILVLFTATADNTSGLVHILLAISWPPWAAHTGYDGEEEYGSESTNHHPYHLTHPLHIILHHLILPSTAVLVDIIPTAEHRTSLLTRGAVKPCAPLPHQVYVSRTVLRTKNT